MNRKKLLLPEQMSESFEDLVELTCDSIRGLGHERMAEIQTPRILPTDFNSTLDIGKTLRNILKNDDEKDILIAIDSETLFNLCYGFYKDGDVDSSKSNACLGMFREHFGRTVKILNK